MRIESLENRYFFSINIWKPAADGRWSDAVNWSLGHVPTMAEDVQIAKAGNYTVTLGGTIAKIKSLSLAANLYMIGSQLDLAGGGITIASGGFFELKEYDGSIATNTIRNATITTKGTGRIGSPSGYFQLNLENVGLNADLYGMTGGAELTNVTLLNGHKLGVVWGTGPLNAYFTGLKGSGEVFLNGSPETQGGSVFDGVPAGVRVHGRGLLNLTNNAVNYGTIEADDPDDRLIVASLGSSWTNYGLLRASNATLNLGSGRKINNGALMSDDLGVVEMGTAFDAASKGIINIGIGGSAKSGRFGKIIISNKVTFGGTLNTYLTGSYVPVVGESYPAIKYTGFAGSFATNNLDAGNGIVFGDTYGKTSLVLKRGSAITSVANRSLTKLTVLGTSLHDNLTVQNSLGVIYARRGSLTSVFSALTIGRIVVGGGGGNDSIAYSSAKTASRIPSTLMGDAGNDSIVGSIANDVLTGGSGSDLLKGDMGDDTYLFSDATTSESDVIDELTGGGIDTIDFSPCTGSVSVDLTQSAIAKSANRKVSVLVAGHNLYFENARGGMANDILAGNSATNLLEGNAGNDKFYAGGDPGLKDTLNGGTGTDLLGTKDSTDFLISIP